MASTTLQQGTGATKVGGRHASGRGRPPLTDRAKAERSLGWKLAAPAATVMILVTAFPIGYALWLSLQRYDLRTPGLNHFIGLDNYQLILTSGVFWQSTSPPWSSRRSRWPSNSSSAWAWPW